MFCPSCGTAARRDQKFCIECGTSLQDLAPDSGEVPTIRAADGVSPEVQDEVTRAMGPPVDPRLRPPPGTADPSRPPSDDRLTAAGTARSPAVGGRQAWDGDPDATTRLPAIAPADAPTRVDVQPVGREPAADRTRAYARPIEPYRAATAEQPAPYGPDEPDEWHDAGIDERPRRRFHFRVAFLPALLAAAAAVIAMVSVLIEIRPDTPNAPFENGTWMVNDFGTNNTVAAVLAVVAVVLGAMLWCFGFRWGAGLAGGGGLALAGWAALLAGLAEWRIADAERLAGIAPATIGREVGYWSLAAAGALGVLVFVTSLTGSGRDRQGGLDPWIAALGAASVLVAAGGPLIPLGEADVTGNYNSSSLAIDMPDLFFAGRLVQLGLFAFAGIVGFLLVRRFGLGLAIAGATVVGFQLATAATDQTETPIGPAFANPGSLDLAPHGVTVVGMALAGFFALVAVVMALLDSGR